MFFNPLKKYSKSVSITENRLALKPITWLYKKIHARMLCYECKKEIHNTLHAKTVQTSFMNKLSFDNNGVRKGSTREREHEWRVLRV